MKTLATTLSAAALALLVLVAPFMVLQFTPWPYALVGWVQVSTRPDGSITRTVVQTSNLNLGKIHTTRRMLPAFLQRPYMAAMPILRKAYFRPLGSLYCLLARQETYRFL